MKIAVGGFQHETNSFAKALTTYADFERTDGWPGLSRGETIFDVMSGRNIPAAGFIQEALAKRHALVPLVWAQAQPGSFVTVEAFERVSAMMIEELTAAGPVDAVYLDLHGAMVTQAHEDGEGELLRRIRGIVGPEVMIAASLDLHANVTKAMVANADVITAYRTYPHIDMAETGARAAGYVHDWLSGKRRPAKALRHTDFLIPITSQCSLVEPTKGIYELLERIEARTGVALNFTPGFPPADIHECGPAIFGFGPDSAATGAAVQELLAAVYAAEAAFGEPIYAPDEVARKAISLASNASRPVVLADTQDNPGAGSPSDTMGLIEALIAAKADSACVALVFDPRAAEAAHQAGVGAEIDIALGGNSNEPGQGPLRGCFTVKALGDGNFTATGPMYAGAKMRLGLMARLQIDGVEVLVASARQQPASQAIFRHLGVEPTERKILGLKSSVHFRNDFQEMAEAVLVVAAPGVNLADPSDFPYQNLRPGLRKRPVG
jgi:microcystin degradation protein MlrC